MVTHFENVAERPVAATIEPASTRGLWARAVGHVQAAVCGLHGHDPMLQFEQGRMFLRCASCGYESPGWDTGERLGYVKTMIWPRYEGSVTDSW